MLYFIQFYKNKILKEIPLNIQNENNNEEQAIEKKYKIILSEYFEIGYLYDFIYRLSINYNNKSILKTFNNYLDNFINSHLYLTKKYKYNYSTETFQLIKNYIFLNAKNGYFFQLDYKMDEKLLLEFILGNERLSSFNLRNPKNAILLDKILLSFKYDYTDYIINNWNTIFPLHKNKEKKYNKKNVEIDGDDTGSEEDSEEEDENGNIIEDEFLINLNNFIKSILFKEN